MLDESGRGRVFCYSASSYLCALCVGLWLSQWGGMLLCIGGEAGNGDVCCGPAETRQRGKRSAG
jgi:hypothetical protein